MKAPTPDVTPTAIHPLYVDLDGTLAATDTLWESLMLFVKAHPLMAFRLPFWALQGRAAFKQRVADHVLPNPALLPYRPEVLNRIEEATSQGREVILATAADVRIAQSVAEHLQCFDAVLSTENGINLIGPRKLEAIQAHAPGPSFDYIGDSTQDIPIWQAAHQALLIKPSATLRKRVNKPSEQVQTIPTQRATGRTFFRALRLHQWIKNLLIFVPLLLAHLATDVQMLGQALLAFLAFSLCASSVYVLNDLLDLEADRQHPRKQYRAFASGALSIPTGIVMIPMLILISFGLSFAFLPAAFTAILGLYLAITLAYSLYLKRVLIVDVLTLAGLYTLRIFAGGAAVDVPISEWLVGFSLFFFLSLAFAKRHAELKLMVLNRMPNPVGRSYKISDMNLLQNVGPACGYISVLVLTLYMNSTAVMMLYETPRLLWLIIPIMLYWITRVWLLTQRGEMNDDPIVFMIKDKPTYLIFALIGLIALAAA